MFIFYQQNVIKLYICTLGLSVPILFRGLINFYRGVATESYTVKFVYG